MREDEQRSRALAKTLRRRMTHAEVLIWIYINRAGAAHRFLRQHPIGPYVADFACVPARLIVEVDGATHSSDEEIAYDRIRTAYLRSRNWRVVRVTNEDVYTNLSGVLEAISALLPTPRS